LRWFLLSMVVDSTEDRKERAQMTGKIERQANGHHAMLRLIGHLHAAHLGALQALLESHGPRTVLDLDQVTLVDVEVVRFLGTCEMKGTELLHCHPISASGSHENSGNSEHTACRRAHMSELLDVA
jgi:hypothetical protein